MQKESTYCRPDEDTYGLTEKIIVWGVILLPIVLFFVLFLAIKVSHAEVVASCNSPVDDYENTLNNSYYQNSLVSPQGSANDYYSLNQDANISSIDVGNFKRFNSPTASTTIFLELNTPPSQTQPPIASSTPFDVETYVPYYSAVPFPVDSTTTFTFATPVALTAGQHFRINIVECYNNVCHSFNSNAYSGTGVDITATRACNGLTVSGDRALYRSTFNASAAPSSTSTDPVSSYLNSYITFNFPADSISLSDFPNTTGWLTQFYYPNHPTSTLITVSYGTSSLAYSHSDQVSYTFTNNYDVTGFLVGKSIPLSPGRWYARASLGSVASSSEISFTINSKPIGTDYGGLNPAGTGSSINGTTTPPTTCGTATSTLGDIFYDPIGTFSTAICKSFAFLFIPSASSTDQFQNISPMIKSKIPFSYIADVAGAFTDYSTTTQSFPSYTIDVPSAQGTSSMVLFSTSTIDHYYTDPYRIFFRFLMLLLLYFEIGMIVWHEAEKLLR